MKPETKRTESKRQNRGVFQEDIEAAVDKAVAIFGPQGRMIPSEAGAIYNARLGTPALGTVWYGDLGFGDIKHMEEFAKQTGIQLQFAGEEGF